MECIIPLVVSYYSKKRANGREKTSVPDLFLSQYDQFDDYLEMVIQFGVNKLLAKIKKNDCRIHIVHHSFCIGLSSGGLCYHVLRLY